MKDSAPVRTLHSSGNSRDPLICPSPIPKKKKKKAERSGLASRHPQPELLSPTGFVEHPNPPVGKEQSGNVQEKWQLRAKQAWLNDETLTPH